jgi:ribosome assembly protein RRB1
VLSISTTLLPPKSQIALWANKSTMGKKSKRRNTSTDKPQAPPAARIPRVQEEETKDNLRYEDDFEDVYEEEEQSEGDEQGDEKPEEEEMEPLGVVRILNPYIPMEGELEMDPAGYKMYHGLAGEWPSMTLDFIQDTWGDGRTRFPHQLLAVVGTCAPTPQQNSVQVWKLSDLAKIETEEDDEGAFDEDDDSDSDVDCDPVLEHYSLNHYGCVNRLRVHKTLVASWSETGKVHLYNIDVEGLCQESIVIPSNKKAMFIYSGHSTEGYGMDFSKEGTLATGDNNGDVHIWTMGEKFSATPMYTSDNSVEDIQWSPTEATVLAAAESGGCVKIYDTRAPKRSMLTQKISETDVNGVAWNKLVTNLLATGCDDGKFEVWDLRKFSEKQALARFTSHKTPISSLQWHPTDESMLVVSDDVGSFVYDLSVEADDTVGSSEIPPQLLFVHSGSPQTKEVRWHPQISSCLMSTAVNGFSVFIPSNL